MFTLLIMCVGTRFLTLVPLDELLLHSLFGKNIRRHQPFDYDRDLTLSTDDPRPVKEQAIQDVLAHWVPRFLVDAMLDLVVDNDGTTLNKGHTPTYKDPDSVISPLIASHLQKVYHMKPRVCGSFAQNTFLQFRHYVEQETTNGGEEIRDFITIPKEFRGKDY